MAAHSLAVNRADAYVHTGEESPAWQRARWAIDQGRVLHRRSRRGNPQRQQAIDYRIAADRQERTEAFRFVYRNYLESGLIEPNRYRLRVTPYHLLPTTQVFVAVAGQTREDVVCTLTLVGDGLLGLPMECSYADEVDRMRANGVRLAEVSCLAFGGRKSTRFWDIFLGLNRLMAQYARTHDIDRLLIAAHPKHSRFYRRMMGFQQIGGLKRYRSVCHKLAVACCLDFEHVDRLQPPCYAAVFGRPVPAWRLSAFPIPAIDCDHFLPAAHVAGQWVPFAAVC